MIQANSTQQSSIQKIRKKLLKKVSKKTRNKSVKKERTYDKQGVPKDARKKDSKELARRYAIKVAVNEQAVMQTKIAREQAKNCSKLATGTRQKCMQGKARKK